MARSDRACSGDGSMPDSLDGFPAVPSNGLGLCCFIHTSFPASAGMVLPAESVWPSDSLAAGFGKPCLPSSLCAPLSRLVAEERSIKRQKGAERSCHCHHQMALLNLSAPYQSVVRHKTAASRFRRSWYRRVLIHSSFLPVVSEIVRKGRC